MRDQTYQYINIYYVYVLKMLFKINKDVDKKKSSYRVR